MHPRLSTRIEVSASIDGADCWFVRADDLRYVHRPEERSSINHAVAVSAQAAERPSNTRQTIVDFPTIALVASIGASTRCLRCERDMLGLTPEALAQSASHQVQSLIQTVRATPSDVPDAIELPTRESRRPPSHHPPPMRDPRNSPAFNIIICHSASSWAA